MDNYRYGSLKSYRIEFQFVWVTKHRYKVLTVMLHSVLGGWFASPLPNMAPSETMRRVKGRSARKMFEEFPLLKKRYWGRHFWARGFFCVTAGNITNEMIKSYLDHHFEPSPNDNFRTES